MPAKIALLFGILVVVCSCSYTFKHEITEFSQSSNKPNISGEWKTDEDPETKKSYGFTIQEIGDQYKLSYAETKSGETKEYWVKLSFQDKFGYGSIINGDYFFNFKINLDNNSISVYTLNTEKLEMYNSKNILHYIYHEGSSVKTITNSARELIAADSSYGIFDKFFIKIYRN